MPWAVPKPSRQSQRGDLEIPTSQSDYASVRCQLRGGGLSTAVQSLAVDPPPRLTTAPAFGTETGLSVAGSPFPSVRTRLREEQDPFAVQLSVCFLGLGRHCNFEECDRIAQST